jgi:hypothetical protein
MVPFAFATMATRSTKPCHPQQPATTSAPAPAPSAKPQLNKDDLLALSKDDVIKVYNTQFNARLSTKGISKEGLIATYVAKVNALPNLKPAPTGR